MFYIDGLKHLNLMGLFTNFRSRMSAIAPGLFIVGYIIGTGSVTSMVLAGARYGMSLTWALLMSCFFTFIMIVAISKITIVTQKTIIFNIRQRFGAFAAIFIIAGLLVTITSSISGVTGVVVEVLDEATKLMFPASGGLSTLISSAVILSLLVYLFWTGMHKLFLRFVTAMVGVMGISFVLANFLIVQDPGAILAGLIPGIPTVGKPHLIIAGIVGTTMAAVVLVSRSMVVAEKKWTVADLRAENKDALISMILTFVISGAIMVAAAGTLYKEGIHVENAIEMVRTLEPLAGDFALALFVTGILAAGLSSIFPNIVLLPWLICDFMGTERNLKKPLYRAIAVVIGSMGLLIPVFGGKPVAIMIASQAFSPVMMPLLIIFLIIMLNSKKMMGTHTNGPWLNAGLGTTLLFSLFMFYIALEGYLDVFN
ncbi:MAG: divalent metal cation transporter [Cyclobacteriaceae bacterium]|nr:divalent metal cation transporter [Cyclobacteriaceae bacterium]